MTPTNAELKVGFECNNNCRFCLNSHKKDLGSKSTNQIKQDVLEAKRLGCKLISFTGGEPSIREDFIELCAFAANNGLMLEIHTNGRVFSYDPLVRSLSVFGSFYFLVSVHGSNAKMHDSLTRAAGSFAQTLKGISNLKKSGHHVTTNTVITKSNVKYLRKIVRMLKKYNVDIIELTWPEPMGAAKENFSEIVPDLAPSVKYICDTLDQNIPLTDAKDRYLPPIIKYHNLPWCVMPEKYHKFASSPSEIADFESSSITKNARSKYDAEKKILIFQCKQCVYKKKFGCNGVFRVYLDFFSFPFRSKIRK